MSRALGTLQVAALLVSASYGIGFLFGSGELALSHGMAGSIYGVATGFGMLVLAVFARQLWATGLPVWDLFGRAYGKQLQGVVALLSLIWMSGVLAAQIQGGVAVLELLGLEQTHSHLVILLLIYGASRLDLRFASALFAMCLLASAAVLVYALVVAKGTRLIRESFELSDRTYGSPRVWHDLRALGESCGMNRVIRLMHQAKLQARHKRRRLPGDTGSRLENHIAPNHLQRDFEASAPNQKWVADFTYIWTAEGWLYAAAVMDLYSRRIVGWSMSDTMQAKMVAVADALLSGSPGMR